MNPENLTILLVEDDPNDVMLVKRAFEKANIVNPIQVVDNGEDAQDYLLGEGKFSNRESFPLPVIILLDLKLPRRSGLEVLEWLRQQPNLKRIPVVILSSSTENRDINNAYDIGVNSYLIKPVEFNDLLDLVKNLKLYWLLMNKRPDIDQS
jgi:CheY-like chemotaxis protein